MSTTKKENKQSFYEQTTMKEPENRKWTKDYAADRYQILNLLVKDYINMCLVDLQNNTAIVLKTSEGTLRTQKDPCVEVPYDRMSRKAVEAFVAEPEKQSVLEAVKRETVLAELSDKQEYSFVFEAMVEDQRHDCQMKYLRLDGSERILMGCRMIDEIVAREKERKNNLEKEKADAIAANEMKSRFLSSLSHDIRTPINGIQGMLRIADTYPTDMKKQNECREKMWIASNYLVSLVNNVLNMNRLENKSIDLTEQPFNLIDLLMDITAMADMQINAQGLHSIVDWKPGYITHRYLIGSAEGLSRILMNLNSNAVKYNKKGGTVYCRCIEKSCDGEMGWFEFTTSDTGIGMSEEFLHRAFDAYSQENNTSLNSMNGVGLGLSIVKQTVALMGGKIKVDSKLNEGTTYTILLPFKIDPNPKVEKPQMENVSLNGVRALLVEDNDLNLEIAKFHLEQENVEVFTAVNGQEAVELFEQSEPGFFDIILMDIMMPIMNGLDATKYIRALDRTDALTVPIIAMSANAFEQDIQMSLEAGLNAHLTKPLDGEKLAETMKKYLLNKMN